MTTTEATRTRILEQAEGCISNGVSFTDLIKEKFNCADADIDAEGDIWVAGPQTGHWLDEDALTDLADWIDAQ